MTIGEAPEGDCENTCRARLVRLVVLQHFGNEIQRSWCCIRTEERHFFVVVCPNSLLNLDRTEANSTEFSDQDRTVGGRHRVSTVVSESFFVDESAIEFCFIPARD